MTKQIDLHGCEQHNRFFLSSHTDWDLALRIARDCDECVVEYEE